jgi:hypothetical protein
VYYITHRNDPDVHPPRFLGTFLDPLRDYLCSCYSLYDVVAPVVRLIRRRDGRPNEGSGWEAVATEEVEMSQNMRR